MTNELFTISRDAVRRVFDRAAASYDEAAIVQQEIGRRLLERLDYLRMKPRVVLDLGTGTGGIIPLLRMRYPKARLIGVDVSEGMLQRARQHDGMWHKHQWLMADAGKLPLLDSSVDLIYSNLMVPWCGGPEDTVWKEMRRVLRPDGALLMTTLGPDTLIELRTAMAQIDPDGVHVHPFIDMHDIGDALVRHGFSEPVMDVETLTVEYGSVEKLLQDIRQTGASNVAADRSRAINKRVTPASITANYPADSEGKIVATVEIVYGHGWVPKPPSQSQKPGEVFIPISSLRADKS